MKELREIVLNYEVMVLKYVVMTSNFVLQIWPVASK